jgi:putative transposase
MVRRYRYRLYPTTPQRRALAKTFGCARVVYNDAVAARETARREDQSVPDHGGVVAEVDHGRQTHAAARVAA